jgi:hypothetical protein
MARQTVTVLKSFAELGPFFGLTVDGEPKDEEEPTRDGVAARPNDQAGAVPSSEWYPPAAPPPAAPIGEPDALAGAAAGGAEVLPAETAEPPAPPPTVPAAAGTPDLARLLAELEAAGATLAAVARRDQDARAVALRDLERYDRQLAHQQEAEAVCARARHVRGAAEALAAGAYSDEARAAAAQVANVAAGATATAARVAEGHRREAERLAATLDLERLLAERRRQEEAQKAEAAAAERAGRLAGVRSAVSVALAAGRIEEAEALLGPVTNEYPDDADLASLVVMVAQRRQGVKAAAAEQAMQAAHREARRDPGAAVARLEALAVDGLPDALARRVFGAWAQACARLCRERGIVGALRYAPDPGRGAVLAPERPDGPYLVLSALGMGPAWVARATVDEHYVRQARPLRQD